MAKHVVMLGRLAVNGTERSDITQFIAAATAISLTDPEVRPLVDVLGRFALASQIQSYQQLAKSAHLGQPRSKSAFSMLFRPFCANSVQCLRRRTVSPVSHTP